MELSDRKEAILARMSEPDERRKMSELIDMLVALAPMDGVDGFGLAQTEGPLAEPLYHITASYRIASDVEQYVKKKNNENISKFCYNYLIYLVILTILDEEHYIHRDLDEELILLMVKDQLEPVFDRLDIAPNKRAQLAEHVVTVLMSPDAAKDKPVVGSFTAGVVGTRPMQAARRPAYLDMPKKAPELWLDSTEKSMADNREIPLNDALFAFTIRVYGPDGVDVLRADNTGMALNDLKDKELDVPLHDELIKAKKRLNKKGQGLPDDCPLPTLKERNTAVLTGIYRGELQKPDDHQELVRLERAKMNRAISFP